MSLLCTIQDICVFCSFLCISLKLIFSFMSFFCHLSFQFWSELCSASLHQLQSHPGVTWSIGSSLRGTIGESLTHKELLTRQNAPSGNIPIACVCVNVDARGCACECVATANAKHRLGFNGLSRSPQRINHRYKHSNCILSGWLHRSVIWNILKAWNQRPKLTHIHTLNA